MSPSHGLVVRNQRATSLLLLRIVGHLRFARHLSFRTKPNHWASPACNQDMVSEFSDEREKTCGCKHALTLRCIVIYIHSCSCSVGTSHLSVKSLWSTSMWALPSLVDWSEVDLKQSWLKLQSHPLCLTNVIGEIFEKVYFKRDITVPSPMSSCPCYNVGHSRKRVACAYRLSRSPVPIILLPSDNVLQEKALEFPICPASQQTCIVQSICWILTLASRRKSRNFCNVDPKVSRRWLQYESIRDAGLVPVTCELANLCGDITIQSDAHIWLE